MRKPKKRCTEVSPMAAMLEFCRATFEFQHQFSFIPMVEGVDDRAWDRWIRTFEPLHDAIPTEWWQYMIGRYMPNPLGEKVTEP